MEDAEHADQQRAGGKENGPGRVRAGQQKAGCRGEKGLEPLRDGNLRRAERPASQQQEKPAVREGNSQQGVERQKKREGELLGPVQDGAAKGDKKRGEQQLHPERASQGAAGAKLPQPEQRPCLQAYGGKRRQCPKQRPRGERNCPVQNY